MPYGCCRRHGPGQVCTCSLGNLSRFVEPVLLYLLKTKNCNYGYDLMAAFPDYALTDPTVDSAAIYRTLRQLEAAGMVSSVWDASGSGPARRCYALTPSGEERLLLWLHLLEQLSGSIDRFVERVRVALPGAD